MKIFKKWLSLFILALLANTICFLLDDDATIIPISEVVFEFFAMLLILFTLIAFVYFGAVFFIKKFV
jgi:hypothetical protein